MPSPNAPAVRLGGLALDDPGGHDRAMKRKAKGKGNGPGKGKTSVSTSIPKEIDAKLRALADKGGVSRGSLARAYIIEGVLSGRYIEKVWKATDVWKGSDGKA